MYELFDRQRPTEQFERALLVHVDFPMHMEQYAIYDELVELAESAGAEHTATLRFRNDVIHSKYFVGTGQIEIIKEQMAEHQLEVVIINHQLNPTQERNISRLLQCKVIDRIRLILDIFALRARTYEGKLQVELAQLKHQSTRLVGGWTHLERQKGGIGLRGPGETQLESDRRLIQSRITSIEKRIEKIRNQRQLRRNNRQRQNIPTVVLVGYTNAGKSTLFNALCHDDIYVADQLFATLDTTLRKVSISGAFDILLADSVGFIRHLPHDLIQAFHATLEEVAQADLLLQTVDYSDPEYSEKIDAVNEVLTSIGAESVQQIIVLNKIDKAFNWCPLPPNTDYPVVHISAQSGEGLEQLQRMISELLQGKYHTVRVKLEHNYGANRAKLYEIGEVFSEEYTDDGRLIMEMHLSTKVMQYLQKHPQFEII